MRPYKREELVWGNLVREQAKAHRNKTFLVHKDQDITYGQLDEMVNRVANGLAAQGVQRGDKVALMLPNSPDILYALLGLAKLGAVSVPINTAYKGDLLEHILKSSDSSMLVVEDQWLDRVALVEGKLPGLGKVIVRTPVGGPAHPGGLQKPTANFRALLDNSAKPPEVTVTHGETQALMYTSGTTGPSKGVEMAHAHGPTTSLAYIEYLQLTEQDVVFSPMPLFHGVGIWQGVLGTLIAGAKIVVADRFSASQWWSEIDKHKATVGMGIFSIPPILLNQPPSPNDRKHPMTRFYIGPSSLDPAFQERFGARVVEIYGSTEVGICTAAPYDQLRTGSCGRVRGDVYDVKIFDDMDREAPPGQPGEICVRPKVPFSVFTGYYNFDAATVKAWRNLWFHTGDRGYMDKDGFFYFLDRQKDSVRRRGENISSFEVERVLDAHPAVLESAVIAVPSELAEDEIKACLVLRPGAAAGPEEILDFCQERMAYFMVPRYLEFMKALPKTPTEKVEKYKLRQEGNKGITARTWDRDKAGYKVQR